MKHIELWLALIILIFLAWALAGCEKEPAYQTSEYKTSMFQWKGPISRKYSDMMLAKYGLEHNGGWRIDCPKCAGASIRRRQGEIWTDYRRFTNTMGIDDLYAPWEGCQWYCENCRYPMGTDWKVVAL